MRLLSWQRFLTLRNRVGHIPWLYYPLFDLAAQGNWDHIKTGPDSEIVIEGPARSANSFARAAFEQAQGRTVAMGRHHHVAAQVLRAVQLGVPAVVLLRRAEPSIRSHLIFEPRLTPAGAVEHYCRFYEALWPLREGFVVASFEEVTGDFGAVIERVNARFGTCFRPFRHGEEALAAVSDRLEAFRRERSGVDPFSTYLPNPVKEAAKQSLNLSDVSEGLVRADALYRRFLPLCGTGAGGGT